MANIAEIQMFDSIVSITKVNEEETTVVKQAKICLKISNIEM